MQVVSDKNWQDQKSVLRNTLPEDIATFYIETVEKVATDSESEIEVEMAVQSETEPSAEMVVVAVRGSLQSVMEANGFLVPEAMSSLLTVLMMHWVHGQLLADGLSPIEKTLVVDAMSQYIYQKQEEASDDTQ